MPEKRDSNFVVKLEKTIKDKYGDIAILNPKSLWSIEDEESYQREKIKQVLMFSGSLSIKSENIGSFDFNLDLRLIRKEDCHICSECGLYSFLLEDELYMLKFNYCKNCFLKNEFKLRNRGIIK